MPKREPMTHADKLYNKRYDIDQQWYWINELNEIEDNLTEWELDFIASLEYQLDHGKKSLSEKQIDVLEKIYNDKI